MRRNFFVSVAQNDNGFYCECPECTAIDEKEGSPSGSLLNFVNAVADKVAVEYPEATIGIFAYNYTRTPPKNIRSRDNEPSHHVPYFYNYSGAPWKTQERVREIMEYKYDVDSMGILGNDDMGQMSAWFVFSALVFYSVEPGEAKYQIGSPLFENAVIDMGDYYGSRTFTVVARNNSANNKYIQSATLNGKPLERIWITHPEITEGGELVLQMGPEPNKHLWKLKFHLLS